MILSLLTATTLITGATTRPQLHFENRQIQATLGEAYPQALHNLLDLNAIKVGDSQNRTGLLLDPPGTFERAGGDYQEPWTRDASINSWNALSLLEPKLAQNTLWAVCEKNQEGKITVQNDNQWWDKIIWVIAAWNHYATTGNRSFLEKAYETADELATHQIEARFDKEFGLFQGPSHLQDGIAGYPPPFDDPAGSSSFILDHPGSEKLMCLSVNCLYVQAFRCLAQMSTELKKGPKTAKEWKARAEKLRKTIDERFWIPETKSYAYLLYGVGDLRGKQAKYQEATGLSFAIMFGIPDAKRAREVVKNARTTRYGIPLVDPEFSRYSADKPGRHSRIVWPLAQGYWSSAAIKVGNIERFQKETETLAELAKSTNWNFYEIYNPTTGKPDGGWQSGGHWGSCTNQAWSASSYVRMIHYGLFGMSFAPDGLTFAPTLPASWGSVSMKGLRYRGAVLDIQLTGSGRHVASVVLDGKETAKPTIPATLTGKHEIEIHMTR